VHKHVLSLGSCSKTNTHLILILHIPRMNTVVIKNQRTASQRTLMQTKVGQLWRKWLVIDKGYKLQRYVFHNTPRECEIFEVLIEIFPPLI
jgi:hypothetical protein